MAVSECAGGKILADRCKIVDGVVMLARSLKTFLTVARTGSFTRAAEEVHLAQSSVSDQIQALEAELGVSLFDRSRTGPTLTRAGEVLQSYAEELLLLADEARTAIDAVTAQAGGSVTIGALETIASTRLADWVAGFRRGHPDVTLTIKVAGSGDLLRQVATGEIDVAFRFDPPALDERLAKRAISTEPLVLIAPPGEDGLLIADLAALAGARFVVTELGCAYRRLFDEAFIEAGFTPPRPAAEVGSVATITRLVARGAGLGLVPRLAVVEAVERGEVVAAPWPGPPASLVMIWRRRRVQTSALKHFLAASDAFEPVRSAGDRPRHVIPSRS